MTAKVFKWKCRELGCGAVHLSYKEHIDHLMNVHNLLKGIIYPMTNPATTVEDVMKLVHCYSGSDIGNRVPLDNLTAVLTTLIAERDQAMKELVKAQPRNVVAAVIRRSDGRYLIGKRRPEQWMGNRWCFIGGKVEPDESLEGSVMRECREELAIDVTVGTMRHHQLEQYENGLWSLHYFDCQIADDQAPRPIECADYAFALPGELRRFDLLPVDIDIARQIAMESERDAALERVKYEQLLFRNFAEDVSDGFECLPDCNSLGHEDLCPRTNTVEAWRQLRAAKDAALAEVERLREAIKFQSHDNQNCIGLCGWCDIQRSTSECNHENCIWVESGGEE